MQCAITTTLTSSSPTTRQLIVNELREISRPQSSSTGTGRASSSTDVFRPERETSISRGRRARQREDNVDDIVEPLDQVRIDQDMGRSIDGLHFNDKRTYHVKAKFVNW